MTTTVNETMTVGTKLVELCRQGEGMTAIETLYDANCTSVEAAAGPDCEQVMNGIAAIKGKNEWWYENNELHGSTIEGPFPHGDRFIVSMKYDMTPKAGPMAGQRMTFEEMGLYTVANGRIVREEFFYHIG